MREGWWAGVGCALVAAATGACAQPGGGAGALGRAGHGVVYASAFAPSDMGADLGAELGGDLGGVIRAADAALGSTAGTLVVDAPGVIRTAISLGANHTLHVTVPITIAVAGAIKLSSGDTLECNGGAAVLSSTLPYNSGMVTVATGADGVVVKGCTVSSNHNYFVALAAGTWVTNFQMLGNHGRATNLFFQVNAPTVKASSNLLFEGNSVVYEKPDPQQGESGIMLNGPVRQANALGNHFEGGGHGIEQFGGDAAGYPSLEAIVAAGSSGSSFTGNTCANVTGACIWGSVVNEVVIADNTADGCGDVCFDAEGSAHVVMEGNVAENCGVGCFAQFFSAFGNAIRANTGVSAGGIIVLFKNADPGVPQHQQNTAVTGNTLTCTGKVCAAIYMESNYATAIDGNTVVNGSVVGAGESPLVVVRNNVLSYTLPTTAGLAIPNQSDGGTSLVSGNMIRSAVAQGAGVPCMTSFSNGYNAADTYVIENNVCSGFGEVDLHLTNDGGNHGVPVFWRVQGNFFPHVKIVVDGSNPATGYTHAGNCSANACDDAVAGK